MPGSNRRESPAAGGGTVNPLASDLDDILAHTDDIWEELRGCRLFITGGTGFVGRWLLESLLWANDRRELRVRAVVLTRDPRRFTASAAAIVAHPAIELLAGDMSSFSLPKGDVDYVIHAATETVGMAGTYDPVHKFDADIEGTRRVLAQAQDRGAHRLLFTSSGAVYGPLPPAVTHVPEDYAGAPDPADPWTAYGQAKRVSEFLCHAAAATGGPEVVIARCFAFVGPHLPIDSNYAIGNFIGAALSGGPIVITGDGTAFRSYLYAADLAVWLWRLLLGGTPGRTYNVGSDAPISIDQLARLVASVVHPSAEVIVLGEDDGKPPQRYVPAVDRARAELDLTPLVGLPDAIERTAMWHRRKDGLVAEERERTT